VASKESLHWLSVKLTHLLSSKHFIIVNVYLPNQHREKMDCWRSLLEMSKSESVENIIIVGDFNTTLHHWEKRGGGGGGFSSEGFL
jgi:endonuclease/exonuclease/phosphatase family metal-dependent hydrolase